MTVAATLISGVLGASAPVTTFAGTFSNPDPTFDQIFSTLTHPYAEVYTTDVALGSHSFALSVLYEDSAGIQAILTTTLHILDPCVTPGLLGVPSDGALDTTYVIDTPTQTVDLGHITNGNCHWDFFVLVDNSLYITDVDELQKISPVFQMDPTAFTYGLISNGYIEI